VLKTKQAMFQIRGPNLSPSKALRSDIAIGWHHVVPAPLPRVLRLLREKAQGALTAPFLQNLGRVQKLGETRKGKSKRQKVISVKTRFLLLPFTFSTLPYF
jgi:hypothetical protein